MIIVGLKKVAVIVRHGGEWCNENCIFLRSKLNCILYGEKKTARKRHPQCIEEFGRGEK